MTNEQESSNNYLRNLGNPLSISPWDNFKNTEVPLTTFKESEEQTFVLSMWKPREASHH